MDNSPAGCRAPTISRQQDIYSKGLSGENHWYRWIFTSSNARAAPNELNVSNNPMPPGDTPNVTL